MIGFWRHAGESRLWLSPGEHEISHDGARIPCRSPLTRNLMRFRANVEDVGNFFSKSSKECGSRLTIFPQRSYRL